MTDRICTVCGARVEAERVVRSRYPDCFPGLQDVIEKLRKSRPKEMRQSRPPKEQEYHKVYYTTGGRAGVIGGWTQHERLCGPLREANAQDDFLEQVGVAGEGRGRR